MCLIKISSVRLDGTANHCSNYETDYWCISFAGNITCAVFIVLLAVQMYRVANINVSMPYPEVVLSRCSFSCSQTLEDKYN